MELDPVISGYVQTYVQHNTKARDQLDRLSPDEAGTYLRRVYENIRVGLLWGNSSEANKQENNG